MKQEKELLLKDLCARLPYGVKVNDEIRGDFDVYGICENLVFVRNEVCHTDLNIENIKPYLVPLLNMTEEQQIDLVEFVANGIHTENIVYDWYNKNHFDYRGLIQLGLAIDATNLNIYCLEFKDQDHYELVSDTSIEPKFKVGDKVRRKNNHNIVFTITSIEEDSYVCGAKAAFWFDDQEDYELVPNKFDITTLKPFDSRVLVRDKNTDEWRAHFFSHYDNNSHIPYICIGTEGINEYGQCIPFEGNEHLLGKTEDCDDYYKTW